MVPGEDRSALVSSLCSPVGRDSLPGRHRAGLIVVLRHDRPARPRAARRRSSSHAPACRPCSSTRGQRQLQGPDGGRAHRGPNPKTLHPVSLLASLLTAAWTVDSTGSTTNRIDWLAPESTAADNSERKASIDSANPGSPCPPKRPSTCKVQTSQMPGTPPGYTPQEPSNQVERSTPRRRIWPGSSSRPESMSSQLRACGEITPMSGPSGSMATCASKIEWRGCRCPGNPV